MSASLTLDGVGCVRGGRALFSGLNLSLAPGDAALVTGPNGAGKSSLLRIIAGLLRAQAGSVATSSGMAFAGDQVALDTDKTLGKALGYWARIDGGDRTNVARGLEAMQLAGLADIPVRMLSTGQRKRAALAGVIAGNMPIWLLDEPANGLDDAARSRLDRAIEAHRAAGGIAIIATHQAIELPDARLIELTESLA